MAEQNQAAQAEVKAPVKITSSGILAMLDAGHDRRDIAKHYGVPLATLKRIMDSTPSLKGKRKKPTVPVDFVDDVVVEEKPAKTEAKAAATETASANTEGASENVQQEQPQAQTANAGIKQVW